MLAAIGIVGAFLPTIAVTAGGGKASASSGSVSYTLEGCRASVNAYLPSTFICPDTDYTTGNLGKGWNEFDLVPGRVILGAGGSAPASPYSFVIAVDNCSGALGAGNTCVLPNVPGYDRLGSDAADGTPTLNAESTGSCGTISASAPMYDSESNGSSLYRIITISNQGANSNCVYDFYARLAFNSHLYPGSSLHYNLENTSLGTAGIGSRTISIPVSAILPPGFTKSQTATQGTGEVWGISKQSSPASFNFSNTCAAPSTSNPVSEGVSTVINWTKTASVSGDITVQAVINLVNNAHRAIDVTVSDQLYTGYNLGNPALGTAVGTPIVTPATAGTYISLAAGGTDSYTDTFTVPSGTATSFSDLATANFFDPVFNEQPLGSAQTTAGSTSITVLTATSGLTAVITDLTSFSGSTNFDFSIDSISPSVGTFTDGVNPYTLGTHTNDSILWTSPSLSNASTSNDSGSFTLGQTVYVVNPNTDNGTLSDTATITPHGQSGPYPSAVGTHNVTGNALVTIEIAKTTSVPLNESETFSFTATGTDTSTGNSPVMITIPAGTTGPVDGSITGLHPGVAYTITEPGVSPFPGIPASGPGSLPPITVSLPTCSVTQQVVNTAAPAIAQVQKLTLPNTFTGSWNFTLTGVESNGTTPVSDLTGTPGGTSETISATANGGYAQFTSNLDVDGATYTITETPTTNWDLTSVAGDFGGTAGRVTPSVQSLSCSFTLNLQNDGGKTFECTFTNTERGALQVQKNVTWNGITPDTSQTYSICITGPSYATTSVTGSCKTYLYNGGDQTWTGLLPGTYTVTETNPGSQWTVTGSGGTVTVNPGDTGSTVGATITNARKLGSLKVTKVANWTGPINTGQTFSICITGPSYATANCQTIGSSGGPLTWSNLIPGNYTVTETNPGVGWTSIVPVLPVTVAADGTQATATVTNNENPADVTVVKTQNGAVPVFAYSFSLTSGANTTSFSQTLTTNGTNMGTLDFGKLPPGNYTLCELNVPAGTHSTLQDSPYNGTMDAMGDVCYSFSLSAGVNQTFHIDNRFPGGNALTIGYWKHWNSYVLYGNSTGPPNCTLNKTGTKLMDCFLPQPLGTHYSVTTAKAGWTVLSNPSNKYAENGLAAQLLAAELNISAGAVSCPAEGAAITHGNFLLSEIGYKGPVGSTVSSKNPLYNDFINTAATLNTYNNNGLC